MTTPASADDWIALLRRSAGPVEPPRFGPVPPGLVVPAVCPACGSGAWRCVQIVGETPGIPDAPAAGGGAAMRCSACGFEHVYRDGAPDAAERARRTGVLWDGATRR